MASTQERIQFLRTRYDEDEELAKQAAEAGPVARWTKDIDTGLGSALRLRRRLADAGVTDALAGAALAHAARHDPDRVLRQVAGNRKVLDAWEDIDHDVPDYVIEALAAAYSDHPDYPK